jgi:antitoxin component of MazEF toxin-antitoxin module
MQEIFPLHLTTIGNAKAIILPKEVLDSLQLDNSERLFVKLTQHGLAITTTEPLSSQQLALADEIMQEDFGLLAKLAQ